MTPQAESVARSGDYGITGLRVLSCERDYDATFSGPAPGGRSGGYVLQLVIDGRREAAGDYGNPEWRRVPGLWPGPVDLSGLRYMEGPLGLCCYSIDRSTTSEEIALDDQDWQREFCTRLATIASLPDNWDYEGSPRTDRAILAAAMNLARRLHLEDLQVPFICPIGGGGIQFEWTQGGKHLEIELLHGDRIAFLKETQGPQGQVALESGEFDSKEIGQIRQLLGWFAEPG